MSGPSLAADLGYLAVCVLDQNFSLFTYMSSVCSMTISLADMYYLLELPLTSPFFIIYVGTFAVPIHSVHKVLSV